MVYKIFSLLLLVPVALLADDTHSETCLQCMGMASASHSGCKDCAKYVQQMMTTSSFDSLSHLMESLKKSAHRNCGEYGASSKACQVYHALCQDDSGCDPELLSKLAEIRDTPAAVDQIFT